MEFFPKDPAKPKLVIRTPVLPIDFFHLQALRRIARVHGIHRREIQAPQ